MTRPLDVDAVRRRLIAQRRALPGDELRRRSLDAARRLDDIAQVREATTVAGYHAVRGELDPGPALESLAAAGVRVLLPVVVGDELRFGAASAATAANRFGIPEPIGPTVGPDEIDAVIVPAVAVDAAGHRVGMGGGYYDRTFAERSPRGRAGRPFLVAMVHDEQVVVGLSPEPWDVAMDAIVTPTRVLRRDVED